MQLSLRNSATVLFALFALFAFSGAARAAQDDLAFVSVDLDSMTVRAPQLAVDGARVALVCADKTQIYCAVSEDQGATFGEVRHVATVDKLALGLRRGPRIAATEQGWVVTAIAREKGTARAGDLLTWRSTDDGRTWTRAGQLNDLADSAREGLHTTATGPKGEIACAWIDMRAKHGEVWGASSKDGGASWTQNRLLYRPPQGGVCDCCGPSLAFDPDGGLFVMWRNDLDGARDMTLGFAKDAEASLGAAERLGDKSWKLRACPMDGGAIAATAPGKVASVWRRENEVFFAEPGAPERKLGQGEQPWIAATPRGVYCVWVEKRGEKLLLSDPRSESPFTIAEHAIDPVIVALPGEKAPLAIAWESDENGVSRVRTARYVGAEKGEGPSAPAKGGAAARSSDPH